LSVGNTQMSTEYNFHFNPVAAAKVFDHFQNIVLVPWEVAEF
jgi:inosine-uridine nucleoside N-ribohydrolase